MGKKDTKIPQKEAGQFIEISLRPSNAGAYAYTISYVVINTGIPIEARINPLSNYSRMIVKQEEEITGYESFGVDLFENILQIKHLGEAGISDVKRELETLADEL